MTNSPQPNSTQLEPTAKRRISLQLALLVPFLLQIFGAVGITGYLSIQNGQRTVNDMATRLEKATSKQIGQQLDGYLPLVPKLSKINAAAAQSGNLKQVNTAIAQMSETTQHNAAMVEENNAAMHTMAAEAGRVATSVSQFRVQRKQKLRNVA